MTKKHSRKEVYSSLPQLYPRLWRFCLSLTGSPERANDLAQSTALRAIDKADQYTSGTHLDRWLFVLARRIWLNEVRSETLRTGGGLVAVEDVVLPDKNPGVETNILARQVLSEILRLPEAQRETVTLVYVEGFAYKQAAEMLEIPVGTVMSRLAAARKTLSVRLGHRETGT